MKVDDLLSPKTQRWIAKRANEVWFERFPASGGVRVIFETYHFANNWHVRTRLEPIPPVPIDTDLLDTPLS